MKKAFRIGIIVILLLAGAALLFWYLLMRREVPKHARCIPKDAVMVLTLNLRELALDHSSGKHLFPEMAGKPVFSKELESFTKAVKANGGSGLAETADVLGFFFRDGEEAYWGICASVKDSAKFGKLLREQLTRQFPIKPFSANGSSMIRFDTTSAVLGWNNDAAVLLYPFSNSGAEQTSLHCAKLLAQKEEQSVLADENFRQHELSSFDAAVWIQPEELLEFTQGGSLVKSFFSDQKYISLLIDFTDGEMIARKTVTNNNVPGESLPLSLRCEASQVKAFYHSVMNISSDSLAAHYGEIPLFNLIPFQDERMKKLAVTLDGNFTVLAHDTFSYETDYITYEYDENFERTEKHEMKKEFTRGMTASYHLKYPATAQRLLNEWVRQDSIPLQGNKWILSNKNEPLYMILDGGTLTITNWQNTDGLLRPVPDSWQGLAADIPVGKILLKDYESLLSLLLQQDGQMELLSENIGDLLISEPLIKGKESTCQVRLTMQNKNVNALVQLEELFRKVAEEGK